MTTATPPLIPGSSEYAPSGHVRGARTNEFGAAVTSAIRESRWFLFAVAAQLVAGGIICGLARRPMLAGPLDAYATFLWAAAVFIAMALAAELFRRRLGAPSMVSRGEAYARAWTELRRRAANSGVRDDRRADARRGAAVHLGVFGREAGNPRAASVRLGRLPVGVRRAAGRRPAALAAPSAGAGNS